MARASTARLVASGALVLALTAIFSASNPGSSLSGFFRRQDTQDNASGDDASGLDQAWSSACCWARGARARLESLAPGKGGGGSPASAEAQSAAREGERLLKRRTVSTCADAAEKFKRAYELDPSEPKHANLAAEALNALMRMQTNANAICFDGSNDTPGHRKIWKAYGPESERLAHLAYSKKPSMEFLATYTDSYIFSCSYKGLVSQALTGAGSKYQSLAKKLQAKPSLDSGVGYALLGCFYQEAPWPLHSSEKAKDCMRQALKKGGETRRNLYYAGVVSYKRKEYAEAVKYFKKAATAPCGSVKEGDFGAWMASESKRGLTSARKLLAESGASL